MLCNRQFLPFPRRHLFIFLNFIGRPANANSKCPLINALLCRLCIKPIVVFGLLPLWLLSLPIEIVNSFVSLVKVLWPNRLIRNIVVSLKSFFLKILNLVTTTFQIHLNFILNIFIFAGLAHILLANSLESFSLNPLKLIFNLNLISDIWPARDSGPFLDPRMVLVEGLIPCDLLAHTSILSWEGCFFIILMLLTLLMQNLGGSYNVLPANRTKELILLISRLFQIIARPLRLVVVIFLQFPKNLVGRRHFDFNL